MSRREKRRNGQGRRHRRVKSELAPRSPSIHEQKVERDISDMLKQLSPRSRSEWERAKSRFLNHMDNADDGDAAELEETDFRELYSLHWSPDDVWKTLKHIIKMRPPQEDEDDIDPDALPSVSASQQDSNRNKRVGKKKKRMSQTQKEDGLYMLKKRHSSTATQRHRRFKAAAAEITPHGVNDRGEEVDHIFEHFDRNGDGMLDKLEFKRMLREAGVLATMTDREFSKMVRKDFGVIDADGSLRISPDEFREYVAKMRLVNTQNALLAVDEADGEDKQGQTDEGKNDKATLPDLPNIGEGSGGASRALKFRSEITRPVTRLTLHTPVIRKSTSRKFTGVSPEFAHQKRAPTSPPLVVIKTPQDEEARLMKQKKDKLKAEMMMDLEDAIKADAHNRVSDVLRRHSRVASDRVLLCNGGLPPLVFAVVHGALKSVRVLVEKWSGTIDSTLLPTEKQALLEACDSEDHSKLHNIVQDLYGQSYRRCLLVAAMNNENVEAARNTLKAIHYPKAPEEPELRARPKLRRKFRRIIAPAEVDFRPNLLGEDLIKAARMENKQMLDQTLVSRANPNYQNVRGVSALMVTGMKGNYAMLRSLVQAGAKADLRSNRGNTVVHFLADRKHRTLAVEFIESNHEAKRCLLIPNNKGVRPHELSHLRDIYLADILFAMFEQERQAEIERHEAKAAKQRRKQLAAGGASSSAEAVQPVKMRSTQIPVGSSSVEVAAIKSGARLANLNRPRTSEGVDTASTAAKRRSKNGQSTGITRGTQSSRRSRLSFKAKSPSPKATTKPNSGVGVGVNAARMGHILSGVVKAKAAKSRQHKKAAHEQSRLQKDGFLGKAVNWVCRSCMQNDIRSLKSHLTAGYDVARVDDFGLSAIHHAAAVGNYDMVKLLTKYKADLGAKTITGNTVIHYLENNLPRTARILRYVKEVAPRLVTTCYSMKNIRGETPVDVRAANADEVSPDMLQD